MKKGQEQGKFPLLRVKSPFHGDADKVDKLPWVAGFKPAKQGFFRAFENRHLKNAPGVEIGDEDGNVVVLPDDGEATRVVWGYGGTDFIVNGGQIDAARLVNRKGVEKGMQPFDAEAGVPNVTRIV